MDAPFLDANGLLSYTRKVKQHILDNSANIQSIANEYNNRFAQYLSSVENSAEQASNSAMEAMYAANYAGTSVSETRDLLQQIKDTLMDVTYTDEQEALANLAAKVAEETLRARVEEALLRNDIDRISSSANSVEKDMYGKAAISDIAISADNIDYSKAGKITIFTSLANETGGRGCGFRINEMGLEEGKKYEVIGWVTNCASVDFAMAHSADLENVDGTKIAWVVFNAPKNKTTQIKYEFTYNPNVAYFLFERSMLKNEGDYVGLELYIKTGANVIERLNALEGGGESNLIENALKGIDCVDGTLYRAMIAGQNRGFSYTQRDNGVMVTASGHSGAYTNTFSMNDKIVLEPNSKYGVYIDITAEAIKLKNEQDIFALTIHMKQDPASATYSKEVRFHVGEMIQEGLTRKLQEVQFFTTGDAEAYRLVDFWLQKYNNTGTTDRILDVLFKKFIIFKIPKTYYDLTELDFVSILKNAGNFESMTIAKPRANLLYDGLTLKSLGDSLPETVSFQPYIAQHLGMKYDGQSEINDDRQYKRSAMGGTRVVPVVWSSSGSGASGNSIYMRARDVKHWKPDVLIVLAGYNDTHAGEHYISGGSAIVPDDYGINDAPYKGGEINLISNPSASVPSFGASYRGMVEQLLTDMPYCRIILCGTVRGLGETNLVGTSNDWVAKKNAVIEKIAREYGLPFVNLAETYGVNKFNYKWLTKDELHFSDFGGKRVAQEIIAKAF